MPTEKFGRGDLRWVAFILLLILLAAVYIRFNYYKAFPEASIDLRLSKPRITDEAARFAAAQGFRTAGYREITLFDPDDDARLYLERELGVEKANRLMHRQVSVWRWRARWFEPPRKEEAQVLVSPDGRIVGYDHVVPEDQAGARLSMVAARAIAKQFLDGRTSAPSHLVEEQLQQKPNRYDYEFTWEENGFRAKDATYRYTVVVQGGRIGKYSEYLHVPESWTRQFGAMRSKNDLYATIAEGFWVPLIIAALVLIVRWLRRKAIPWRRLIAIAGAVAALMAISQLNSMPLSVDQFPTSSPYPQTVLLIILGALGVGVGVFFYIIIPAGAGEPLYRGIAPDSLSLRNLFTSYGVSTRRFFRSTLAGYGFAAVHIAYLVAFYLIGQKVGVWSPQDVNYSDLLSTHLPWIYPIATASMAAASEEFWFRLLAIPLLKRALRFTWLAVIIPAFLWGFLHANYPQEPAYIRGIEVGLIGIGAGFMMLRFGILSTLVWHYTVDASLMGMFLFQAGSWYLRVSGWILAIAVLAPLLISIVMYQRRGGFAIEEAAEETPGPLPSETPEPEGPAVEPAKPRWPALYLYAAAAVALIAGLLAHPTVFGSFIHVRLSRDDAQRIAMAAVPDARSWEIATDFIPNLDVSGFEYIRRVAGTAAAQAAVRDHTATGVWRVRFFHAMQKDERRLYIDQQGRIFRSDLILDEKAPGASLPQDQALAIGQKQLPPGPWTLVDSSQTHRDHRTDYSFVWEDPAFKAGAARARVSIQILGDRPSMLRQFLKLPEAWLRDFQSLKIRTFIVPALIGSLGMPLLIAFIKRLGSRETVFHWRAYWLIGGAGFVASMIGLVNQWSTAMSSYDTAIPRQNYIGEYLIARAIAVIFAAGLAFTAALAVDVFRQAAMPNRSLNRPSWPRAIAIAVLAGGLGRAIEAALQAIPGPRRSLLLWSADSVDAYLPGIHPITHGYFMAVLAVCGLGVAVFAIIRYFNRRGRLTLIGVVALAVAAGQSNTPLQFIAALAAVGVWMGVVLLVVRTCGAAFIDFGVAVFWIAALQEAIVLAGQPAPWIHWNGVAAVVAAIAVGIAVLAVGRAARPVPGRIETPA
jgi:Type II CAAX prenyl endopeptidase Rce1-like